MEYQSAAVRAKQDEARKAETLGDWNKASELHWQAMELARQTSDKQALADASLKYARASERNAGKDPAGATKQLDEAAKLYRLVIEEHNRRGAHQPSVQYSDAVILLVAMWAVLHDRPICWACGGRAGGGAKAWRSLSGGCPWASLPSRGTMSKRLTLNLGVRFAHDNGFAPGGCRDAADGPGALAFPAGWSRVGVPGGLRFPSWRA